MEATIIYILNRALNEVSKVRLDRKTWKKKDNNSMFLLVPYKSGNKCVNLFIFSKHFLVLKLPLMQNKRKQDNLLFPRYSMSW